MADIRVDINSVLTDGMDISFKAPCNCTEVDAIKVCYVKDQELVSQRFVLKDAHGNDLTGIGNLFSEGAYVHVILNTTNGFAYIQNADTNGYIEGNFQKNIKGYDVQNKVDLSSYTSSNNAFTIPCDGVIHVCAWGSSSGINHVNVWCVTDDSNDENSTISLGTVTSSWFNNTIFFNAVGKFPVYAGQKVFFTLESGAHDIYFHPYYYG